MAVIDYGRAEAILTREAAKATAGHIDRGWEALVEQLSKAAGETSRTHIAFLGTAILAKCVDPSVDVFAVKKEAGPNAYSARTLCHTVLVRNAPEFDINLGATGREPLNNQPYFRIMRVSRDIPVRTTSRHIVELLCEILEKLDIAGEEEARQALRAFIYVRRQHGARYTRSVTDRVPMSVGQLVQAIEQLVAADSEGGRRAQAVVAALMDVFAGERRVDARRVNDPSRSVPGDVNVRMVSGDGWERVFEVRDKPITREDLYVLVKKCQETGGNEAVMVAVAPSQPSVPVVEAQAWAAERGVALTVFTSWGELARQSLHWAPTPQLEAAAMLPSLVEQRLVELEVSGEALSLWASLLPQPDADPQAA